jgi:hypothetical protein
VTKLQINWFLCDLRSKVCDSFIFTLTFLKLWVQLIQTLHACEKLTPQLASLITIVFKQHLTAWTALPKYFLESVFDTWAPVLLPILDF